MSKLYVFYISLVLICLYQREIYGVFIFGLLVVGKTNHVSSGEGNGGQDGLRSMSFLVSVSVISLFSWNISFQ